MKNRLAFIFLTAFSYLTINGQTPAPSQNFSEHPRAYTQRKSFWFEGNLTGTIKRNDSGKIKWQYQLDWQYRRAGDANYINGGDQFHILKEMQQHVLRPWVHYWAVPGKVRLSVSPIGHWGTWTPKAEGAAKYFTEYRSCYQLTLFQKIGKFDIQQRYRYEFRMIGSKVDSKASASPSELWSPASFPDAGKRMRLRYMMRVNYPLTKSGRSYVSLWDEVFIGLGRHVASNKNWDQNRVVALYGRKLKGPNPIKVEVGFTWQVATKYDMDVAPTQNTSFMKNNVESNLAFQIYLIFDEFHKVFSKQNKIDKKIKA